METEENKYIGEKRKTYVEQTKLSISTHSEKIGDVLGWDEVKNLVRRTVIESDEQVSFMLWNNGVNNGITIVSEKENIAIYSKCDFKIVKNLFIRELAKEQVDKLTIVRNRGIYRATYKTNDTAMVKNYIYAPCDSNDLSHFLESVVDRPISEKEHFELNRGLADISKRGLKGIKGFVKYRGNRSRTYRNSIR